MDIATSITELRDGGWTLKAIAGELDTNWRTVKRWQDGDRHPRMPGLVLKALATLQRRTAVKEMCVCGHGRRDHVRGGCNGAVRTGGGSSWCRCEGWTLTAFRSLARRHEEECR